MAAPSVPENRPPRNINGKPNPAYGRWYRARNAPRIAAYLSKWRAENQDYILAYRADNHEEHLESGKQYRDTHTVERKAYKKAHRLETNAAERKRYEEDEAYRVKRLSRRHIRRSQATAHDLTAAQWLEIKAAYGYRCVYCGRKMERLTMDHITPLANGGGHTRSNVVPACRSCNSRKGKGEVLCPVQPLLLTIA